MTFFNGAMTRTHKYNIKSHLHSWWSTTQPWITLVVALLLLWPIVESKWDEKEIHSCGVTYSEDGESNEGNIVLLYDSGKPLEVTCNLDPNDENVKMLFGGQDKLKQSPSSRIAFVSKYDDKLLNMKYVSIINNTAAKLIIPNPPFGEAYILCLLLTDAYFTNNVPDKSDPPYLYAVCRNQIRVLEFEDMKINIIGTTDTTIDIKLELPLILKFYSSGDIILNYDIEDDQTQIFGPKTLANNYYTVVNDTVIRLENLESNKIYSISIKYCHKEIRHIFCSNYNTIPIRVKTGNGPLDTMTMPGLITTTISTVADKVVAMNDAVNTLSTEPVTKRPTSIRMNLENYYQE